jgi:hypothetical protein
MVDDRVRPGSKEHHFPGSKVKGQKNIFYKNVEISIFTLKEGPIVDDRVRPGSEEHQLPGSKVKKTFFIKTSKSRFSR